MMRRAWRLTETICVMPPLVIRRRASTMKYWRPSSVEASTGEEPLPSPPDLLSANEAVEALARRAPRASSGFLSFYSSVFGGIVKVSHLMVVPMDDHMVHR